MFKEVLKCGLASGILWIAAKLTLKSENIKSLDNISGAIEIKSMWDIGGIVVGAPVVEEIFFRGILQGHVFKKLSSSNKKILTSLMFSAAHWQNSDLQLPISLIITKYLMLYVSSIVHCKQYERTKSLSIPIFSHGLHNYLCFNNSPIMRYIYNFQFVYNDIANILFDSRSIEELVYDAFSSATRYLSSLISNKNKI